MDKNFHTWRKAYAVRGIGFTKAEQDAGWPDDMRIGQVARLQCPGDVPKERKIYGWLLTDCTSGELPNLKTSSISKRQWSKKIPVTFASADWDGVPGKTVTVHGVTDDVVDTYRVTAPALKTWLELIGEPPSEHIAAWFEAVGAGAAVIDAPVVVAPTPSTSTPAKLKRRDELWPVIEKAQREVDDPFDAVAIGLKLCEWAQAKVKTFPLIGITGDAIQWRTDPNDNPKELTLRGLRDRLGKQKRREQPKVKAPLKRVK